MYADPVTHRRESRSQAMATTAQTLNELDDEPRHFPDCCAGISKPLLATLRDRLPPSPNTVLSVGSGCGLLEALLLHVAGDSLNLYGVEVRSCANKHLPPDRLIRVSGTTALHPDAILASSLMFVYPRQPDLVAAYLDAAMGGALEQVVWIGHRNDWAEYEGLLQTHFHKIELVAESGMPSYELLVTATLPVSSAG